MHPLVQFVRRFWLKSISRQLALGFALATALLMLGFGYTITRQQENFLHAHSITHVIEQAHTLAVSSASWVQANDVAGMQEVIQSAGNNPNLRYLLILSGQGRVLASNQPGHAGQFPADPLGARLADNLRGTQLLINDPDLIDVAEPIMAGTQTVGWVRIGMGREDELANVQEVRKQGYFIALLGVMFAILVAMLIARGFTQGLRNLIQTAAAVRKGQRNVRVEVVREDEVGALAHDFNRMLDALAHSEHDLERLNHIYAAWTECSEAIVREQDEATLFRHVCDTLARRVALPLAWIGMRRGDDIKIAAASNPDSGFIRNLVVSVDENRPEGHGPTGIAIREGQAQIFNDFLSDDRIAPWRAMAQAHGFRSAASFPLRRNDRCIGALTVYTEELDFFSSEIAALLRGLAEDLSFALGSLERARRHKEAEQRIYHLAHFDSLTNLPNRVMMLGRLEQALAQARRTPQEVAILFLDLDRFKSINDTLGHSTGDHMLQLVAQRLLDCIRQQDTVSRQGGDEFIIILPDTGTEGAERVAQKIIEAISLPYLIAGHDLHVTPSIGISMFPKDADDIETLIKIADVAMYHAKENGRNNYQFFHSNMNASAYERLVMQSSLREALEHDQFVLYYQPQVDLTSGAIIGCEALIRWQHPRQGLILPGNFIPLAEESGLILAIGDRVLEKACRQIRAWQDAGLPLVPVAVNLSSLQFCQHDMMSKIRGFLDEAGIDARCLELELTESILMQGVETTLATLQNMSAMGLHLSIDDFGTGYSSLSYLKRFPIDKLKIDQSFVNDIVTDASDAAIVRTIIVMSHSLGLRVIAEGVETAEQEIFLRSTGCNEAQGYHFARPMPASDFAAFLLARQQ